MANCRPCRSNRAHSTMPTRAAAFVVLALAALSGPLSAQRMRLRSHSPAWSLMAEGGGSYAMSDLEIVPGTDQNGGWSWDAGLRLRRGRGSIGVGFERTRFDLGPDGAATTSGVYVEPRLYWREGRGGVSPYLFAHGARIFDYDVKFCCSVYSVSRDARGWLVGGGFGLTTSPLGFVRFDLSAGVNRLSGESDERDTGSWKGAGPLMDLRLGASVPLWGGR